MHLSMNRPRKIVIHGAGGYEKLRVEAFAPKTPDRGEVRIAVRAIGVNFADVLVRMGLYESAKHYVGWPITPGFEVAGTVEALGEGVGDLAVGDEVFAVTRFDGYATHVVAPRRQVFRKPKETTLEEAAALPAVCLTAWYALFELAHPRRGSSILVHSAGGGVGTFLVQMAKLAGARVAGVVGASHKVALVRALGADAVIDKSTTDLWREAERFAPDGYDVILDANGVSTLGESYRHLRRTGKLVVYGFHSMMPKIGGRPNWPKLALDWLRTPRFSPLEMTGASKSVLAFNLSYLFDRQDLLDDGLGATLRWLAAGELRPPKVTTYPLDDVARAHADIESGKTTGKLVLVP